MSSQPPEQTPANASHPWVYSATISGDTISFRVEVTDLQTTVGAIEITGVATQVNGAYAPIFRVTDVPSQPNGDPQDSDQAGRYFVDVEATPTPEHPFTAAEDVTVFTRASKVWVTVLGPGSDDGVTERTPDNPGPTWGVHRADSHMSAPDGTAPVGSTLPKKTRAASHPWVYSATITSDKLTFHVEVTDFKTTVGAIEITGVATQVNGAYAPIFRVTDVPAAPNGEEDDPDQAGRYFVDVDATPTPEHPFTATEDVTVFTRASKVWVTVLGPGSDGGSGTSETETTDNPGPTWRKKADSQT